MVSMWTGTQGGAAAIRNASNQLVASLFFFFELDEDNNDDDIRRSLLDAEYGNLQSSVRCQLIYNSKEMISLESRVESFWMAEVASRTLKDVDNVTWWDEITVPEDGRRAVVGGSRSSLKRGRQSNGLPGGCSKVQVWREDDTYLSVASRRRLNVCRSGQVRDGFNSRACYSPFSLLTDSFFNSYRIYCRYLGS